MGFAWSVLVSSKENNRAKTNGGGGERIIGGGSKAVFGKRFYGMFPPPPVSFPTPFFFLKSHLCFQTSQGMAQYHLKRSLQHRCVSDDCSIQGWGTQGGITGQCCPLQSITL